MRTTMKIFTTICFAPLAIVFLSSCGAGSVQLSGNVDDLNGTSLTTTGGLKFTQSLFPLLKEHCSNCHGNVQAPFIAVGTNAKTSYDNIIAGQYANFVQPNLSKIYTKVKSNHNCWTGSCLTDANTLLDQIEVWAAAEIGTSPADGTGGSLPTIQTAEITVPSSVTELTSATSTLALNTLAPGLPSNASLQVTVRLFDASHYQFSLAIRASAALSIYRVVTILNGAEPQGDASLNAVDYTQTAFPVSANYVNLGGAITPLGTSGPGGDKVRFGFEILAPFDPAKIRFNNFLAVVQNSCSGGGCHSNSQGNTPAFSNFTTEAQFLNAQSAGGNRLAVSKNPAMSTIYYYTVTGSPSRMPPSGFNNTLSTTIQTWINGLP